MLLALPLLVGLVGGRLLGGSFQSLAATPIRFGWLFLLGVALQFVLFTPLTDSQRWDISYSHGLYVVSLLLVVLALALNVRRLQWPVYVLMAGAALNLLVILANGGAMPVDMHLLAQAHGQQIVSDVIHHRFATNVTPLTGSTLFPVLGDRTLILASVYSIGDIILGLGILLAAFCEMNRARWSMRTGLTRSRTISPLSHVA